MGLRLAREKDCSFFCFWYGQDVLSGVDCQGELFVTIERFAALHQSNAYERALEVEAIAVSALIIRTDKEYIVCANLTGTTWQTLLPLDPKDLKELKDSKDPPVSY